MIAVRSAGGPLSPLTITRPVIKAGPLDELKTWFALAAVADGEAAFADAPAFCGTPVDWAKLSAAAMRTAAPSAVSRITGFLSGIILSLSSNE
jgi:hypothetical protein